MTLVDLQVEFPRVDPGLVTVQLVGGPCDGEYARVPGTAIECWQRVGRVGTPALEAARYDLNALKPSEYVYSGVTVPTSVLQEALAKMQAAGHTFSETRGA